jgi:hypothetical protein
MNHPAAVFDPEKRTLDRETRLHYLPLRVTRQLTFEDDGIAATVELTAVDAFDVVELYECIPVYVQDRAVSLLDGDLEPVPYTLPTPITTASRPSAPQPEEQRGDMPDAPVVTARAIDVSAESGAGATIVFDEAHTFTQTQPIRYRSVAAATGGFNLVLPTTWNKGETRTLRYRIVPHRNALAPADIRDLP